MGLPIWKFNFFLKNPQNISMNKKPKCLYFLFFLFQFFTVSGNSPHNQSKLLNSKKIIKNNNKNNEKKAMATFTPSWKKKYRNDFTDIWIIWLLYIRLKITDYIISFLHSLRMMSRWSHEGSFFLPLKVNFMACNLIKIATN